MNVVQCRKQNVMNTLVTRGQYRYGTMYVMLYLTIQYRFSLAVNCTLTNSVQYSHTTNMTPVVIIYYTCTK